MWLLAEQFSTATAATTDPALLWEALAGLETPPIPVTSAVPSTAGRPDYEGPGVAEASAKPEVPRGATRWSPAEIVIAGPSHGNPFIDVELTARFSRDGTTVTVGGFYDGDGRWIIRFLPESSGCWEFVTSSNARSLHGLTGRFDVAEAPLGEHGPVRVDGFHFAHADGTRYSPWGTTAYAWIHQPEADREATLRTLESAPFNKLRMLVFPKAYDYNADEPELYPFPGDPEQGFDHSRFDPEFFRRLESAVVELGRRGIQADIILFHPYDRWGFAELGQATDDSYTRYLVRRLWAYPNVWWSMANEYDFVLGKTESDWERLADIVVANDPARHLLSIHNGLAFYDHSRPWITHASVQRIDQYRTAEEVDIWRRMWGKPVVVDECGYEGDLEHGWGNLTGEEMVRRCWEGAIRGGYVGHGETYYRSDEQLWWAKGGDLTGDSPDRIAFLGRIVAESPGGVLEPLSTYVGVPYGGIVGVHHLYYYGRQQPAFASLRLPPDRDFHIDVIDTWEMTVTRLSGVYRGICRISMPGKEFMAVRATAVDSR
ncbi:DUF5605 domain-containing protein [Yinghuangia aomiensis]|uniref:DUF5605 domain-containing protein n=2 Tax=Yinghuangia aomiensis TaxID=676205 RepID=A0ABP9I101_9ACTN